MWWTFWWGCGSGVDCERTADGACAPEVDDDVDGDLFPNTVDCDDSDPDLIPEDLDGDGWSSCQGDCLDDPTNPDSGRIGPRGAVADDVPEACDNLDNDCNGVVDEGDLGSACRVELTATQDGWSQLDLVLLYDTDPSYALNSVALNLALDAFLGRFTGSDTRLGVVDTRGTTGQLLTLDGDRWVAMQTEGGATAATWVRQVIQSAGSQVGPVEELPNRPLGQALTVEVAPNQGFRRERARLGVVVATVTDDQSVPAALFTSTFDGELFVLGPSQSCGGREGPVLRAATAADRYTPACEVGPVDLGLQAAADVLVPDDVIRIDLGDDEIRPATLSGEVVRADGVRVPLGPGDLVFDGGTNEVVVTTFRWRTVLEVHLAFERVPPQIVAGTEPPAP